MKYIEKEIGLYKVAHFEDSHFNIGFYPKGTKTEWNSEPLKILKKLKVLSGNWTYDFKKDRKNIFYDKVLKF